MTTIYTFGHSTMEGETFARILSDHGIRTAVDVRRFPHSRRHPQFDQKVLQETLQSAGIVYAHAPELGGRRRPKPDSPNVLWRLEAFRGYADYMETDDYREALGEALQLESPIAFFCSESLWWKCHRRMIADSLVARAHEVIHIASAGSASPHKLTEGALIDAGTIRYDGGQRRLL